MCYEGPKDYRLVVPTSGPASGRVDEDEEVAVPVRTRPDSTGHRRQASSAFGRRAARRRRPSVWSRVRVWLPRVLWLVQQVVRYGWPLLPQVLGGDVCW
jgi:hypothetical protein